MGLRNFISKCLLKHEIRRAKFDLAKFDQYLFYSFHSITQSEQNTQAHYQARINNLERELELLK